MTESAPFEFREIEPHQSLRSRVRCIWGLRAPAGMLTEPQPILPDGCVEIVFNLADPFRRTMTSDVSMIQGLSIVAGAMTMPVTVTPTGAVDMIGIRFQPWSGGAVAGEPLRLFRNETPELSAIGAVVGDSLRDELHAHPEFDERVRVIERELSRAFTTRAPAPRSLVAALAALEKCKDAPSMRALARDVGTSTRTMQRNFDELVGLNPSLYQRIARMQRALRLRMQNGATTWSRIAQMAGYYDHPHMIHDFQDLAHLSPTSFDNPHAPTLTTEFITDS